MEFRRLTALWLFSLGFLVSAQPEEAKGGSHVIDETDDEAVEETGDKHIERLPSSVFVVEHGFLDDASKWLPRGTLLLSSTTGQGFEARLSDAKEFLQMRPQLIPQMSAAAEANKYYSMRMYSPVSPKRVLQASIPAKLLADNFEDWHDILELVVSPSGVPVSLSYRVQQALGLALFDHTTVHVAEPDWAEGPRVAPKQLDTSAGGGGPAGEGNPDDPKNQPSFLRKYWWIILIAFLLVSSAADDGKGGGKGGKSAGGKR